MGAVKRTISFVNADDEEVTEEWHFQLDESDAVDMQIMHDILATGDPETHLHAIVQNRDSRALLNLWREMLFAAACKREGKLLLKDPDIQREFRYGGAYRQLFSELITADDGGVEFFMSIMPKHIREQAAEQAKQGYSDEELLSMSDEDFVKAAGGDNAMNWDRRFLNIATQRKLGSKAA